MFLETSAKTAYNVEESFNLSAQSILNNIQKNQGEFNEVNYLKIDLIIFIRDHRGSH
jgi:hypothetical protein